MAKAVKVMLSDWLFKWVGEVSEADETTVAEFLRRSAVELCERRDREGSSRVPGAIIAAARASRRGIPRGRLREIAEALGRVSDILGGICIKQPIRGQLDSALRNLKIAADLIFEYDVRVPGNPSTIALTKPPSRWRIAPMRNWTSARRRRLRSGAASSRSGGSSSAFRAARQRRS